jgi:hypothetical protein
LFGRRLGRRRAELAAGDQQNLSLESSGSSSSRRSFAPLTAPSGFSLRAANQILTGEWPAWLLETAAFIEIAEIDDRVSEARDEIRDELFLWIYPSPDTNGTRRPFPSVGPFSKFAMVSELKAFTTLAPCA